MAGRKRAAAEDITTEKRETRGSKAAKTEGVKPAGRAAKGTARLKTSMAQSTFKSRAVPLHVSITTTAPALEGQEPAPVDPGFLASTALIPSTFATGSFGWKGHKRLVVELPSAEGEGEKVHVTMTINATVIGSKDVKEVEEHEDDEKEGTGEHTVEKTSDEGVDPQHGGSAGAEAKDNSPAGEEQAEKSAS